MHMFLSRSFADLGVLETEDRGPFTETYKTHSWPYEQPRPPTTSSSKGNTARGQEGQTQVVTRNRAQYVAKIKD